MLQKKDPLNLTGKVAVITGGSSGIGLGVCELLSAYGAKIAMVDISPKGEEKAKELRDAGREAAFFQCDVTNEEQVKPNILLFTINTAVDLYQKGVLDAETVLNDYEEVMALMYKMDPKSEVQKQQNEKVRKDIESLFISSKIADCDKLISLFTPRFEENPDNLETVSSIVMMMASTEGCTDNDLFLQAATKMHQLDLKYMEEAIASPDSDNLTDAEYYYELAVACSHAGSNAKAFKSALDAIDLDPSYAGKSYMLIGTIWGSQVCPGNEIEQRAPYWVAVDYLVKARNADPSLAEEANRLIGQYSTYFPQTAEAFMYNITDGDSYTVSCGGMRALTTVRTQE